MIPKEVFVALRTDHKSEKLITSESSHRVSFIVALKKRLDPSSVIVALQEPPDPSSVIVALKNTVPAECHFRTERFICKMPMWLPYRLTL